MTFPSSVAAALVVACALLNATTAYADPQACSTAAEDGQRLRAGGKLRAARTKFAECALKTCPTIVRADCAKWGAELAETMPTIIVDARDADLHDVGDVEVIVDGETVAQQLDGKAIPVDPGPHTLVFHRAGSPPVVERVIIKEGVRGRSFAIRFGGPPPAPAAAPAAVPIREHSAWPWVVVGVGGAMVVTGLVVVLTAPRFPSGCDQTTKKCAALPGETPQDLEDRQAQAGDSVTLPRFGTILTGVGAAVVAGGLLWHFLEPTGPAKAAAITPWASDTGAGLAARGTF